MMLISGNTGAQISEPQEFLGTTFIKSNYEQDVLVAKRDGVLYFYNKDMKLIKSTTIYSSFSSSNDDYIEVYCIAKNVFTKSNKYEFVAYIRSCGNFRKVGIYNEDGECLYSFGEGTAINSDGEPFISCGKLILPLVKASVYDGDYFQSANDITYVFTLQGVFSSSLDNIVQGQTSAKLYPNPAKQSVTVEYNIQGQMQQMRITDINGRVVANYLLDPSQKQVQIDTSNYKKGVYVYSYGNTSGKFIVQ
ncbi:MAG: T9SS type A sorting domain-containing protein [Bacteroidales bacterium]|nr:T9SS type A sorting domain-containing protein [Bacteroidales bacterium]